MMDPELLSSLASRDLNVLRGKIPSSPEERFLLLLEIQRYFDFESVDQSINIRPILSRQQYAIMGWGMNLATAELLCKLPTCGGIPIVKSSPELRAVASKYLYGFGLISLLRRAAEMVRIGALKGSLVGDLLVLKSDGRFVHQFMDESEPARLERYMSDREPLQRTPEGWDLLDYDDASLIGTRIGSFSTRPPRRLCGFATWAEMDESLLPLMRPWPTPYGIFLAYDAIESVDERFYAVTAGLLDRYVEEAGIHISVNFSGFSAKELLAVCVALGMVYRKHVGHCLIAARSMPEVDVSSSMTLWQRKGEIIEMVSEATGIDEAKVELILSYFSVGPEDVGRLADEGVPVFPMIIDLGNGMVLRPLSSVMRNELITILAISKWRDTQSQNRIAVEREDWFRVNLYALFRGNRYVCIQGNVLLRDGGRKITDIDAAILDTVTGQLALFQLKWQDYFSNNVRHLGSRAKNFSSEVDAWAEAVNGWIASNNILSVAKVLGLDPKKGEIPVEIYMFALSWRTARSAAYGFPVESPFLSVASWPQFCRVRSEIGPAREVFGRIHEVLREEELTDSQSLEPQPYEIELSEGERILFHDIWSYSLPKRVDTSDTE